MYVWATFCVHGPTDIPIPTVVHTCTSYPLQCKLIVNCILYIIFALQQKITIYTDIML